MKRTILSLASVASVATLVTAPKIDHGAHVKASYRAAAVITV